MKNTIPHPNYNFLINLFVNRFLANGMTLNICNYILEENVTPSHKNWKPLFFSKQMMKGSIT